MRTYRKLTSSSRYDNAVMAAASRLNPQKIEVLGIEPIVKRDRKPPGIGKRGDMAEWFEDARPRTCNPILLATAAQIANDPALATRAIDLAAAYFELARRVYPDGRDHGCSARSVSAIARGHGRDNNAGVVTAVLQPIHAESVK